MKQKRVSLQAVGFRYVLFLSVVLILVTGAITLVHSFFSTMRSYKRETAHNMEYAVSLIDVSYLEKVFAETRRIYDSVPEDIAKDQYSREYSDCFASVIDDDFWEARDILVRCKEKNQLASIALFFPDTKRQRAVFVIDGYDIESAYAPGQYIAVEGSDLETPEEMEKVASSDLILPAGHGDVNGWIATNYIKIFDSKGAFLGYCTCDVDITAFLYRLAGTALIYIAIFAVVVIFIAHKIRRVMKKRIIDPIDSLAAAAEEYTRRDKTVAGYEQSFFDRLSINTNDEIETLYHSLSDMEADINSTMKRIRDMTAEKERVNTEMNLAANIQKSMLPNSFPLFPDRSEFDIYASMDPAKEVGGDFYDAFLIDDTHLCLVIADVSGKGVPASLFMVISKTVIKERARKGGTPSSILNDVNNTLLEENSEMMFVSVWLAILDLKTGEVAESNAGHENPVLIRKDRGLEPITKEHGMVLGVMKDFKQKDGSYTLLPGDRIFVYTDGLTEATNAEGKLFGEPRVLEIIRKRCEEDNVTLLKGIRKDVDEFVKEAPQFDDLTMMVVEYKG